MSPYLCCTWAATPVPWVKKVGEMTKVRWNFVRAVGRKTVTSMVRLGVVKVMSRGCFALMRDISVRRRVASWCVREIVLRIYCQEST
jgi:hypothetical protein